MMNCPSTEAWQVWSSIFGWNVFADVCKDTILKTGSTSRSRQTTLAESCKTTNKKNKCYCWMDHYVLWSHQHSWCPEHFKASYRSPQVTYYTCYLPKELVLQKYMNCRTLKNAMTLRQLSKATFITLTENHWTSGSDQISILELRFIVIYHSIWLGLTL